MGIFSAFKKKAQEPEKPRIIKPLRPFPFSVNGANLRYAYDMNLTPTAAGSIDAALGDAEKIVDVSTPNGLITLSYNGIAFATIDDTQKQKMVSDFLKRGDPVNAVLRSNGKASLRFYRDMRNGAKESEVVELTAYKSASRQENIESMTEGDELGCYEENGQIFVCAYFSQESIIGKLPSKICKRAEDEDIRAIYVEEIKEEINDNYESVYIPLVRIYW